MIAKYQSINDGVTMDIEEGKYKNIGILAGMSTSITNRTVAVTLVYSDTSKEETIVITTKGVSATENYSTGIFYFKNFTNEDNNNSNGSHHFAPFTIKTDPTKTLAAVKISGAGTNETNRCVFVVSAWGVKAGIGDYISLIEEIMADGISSSDEYESVKNYIKLIDEDGNELTVAQQEVYDSTTAAIAQYEANLEEMEKEAARQEAMTKRTYNYLTLSANRDVFVTWKDITDLARFQYDAAGTSKTVPEGYNTEKYTVSETEEIFNWIPHVRADGTTKVTGK